MSDLVSRQYLLDEYDRQHQGPPGGARKIIEEAPDAQPDFNIVEKIDKAYDDGYKCGYLQAKYDYEADMRGEQDG